MRIIDKYTDFYDHYSYVYGVDNKVTYDRRGSVEVSNEILYDKFQYDTRKGIWYLLEIGNLQYIIAVKGLRVKIDNQFMGKTVDCSEAVFEIMHTYNEDRHYAKTPIAIYSITYFERKYPTKFHKDWSKKVKIIIPSLENLMKSKDRWRDQVSKGNVIENPILKNTGWTTILDAEVIWKELQNYLSALNNDEDVSTDMTEKEKASTHGFDKLSFRNPIK